MARVLGMTHFLQNFIFFGSPYCGIVGFMILRLTRFTMQMIYIVNVLYSKTFQTTENLFDILRSSGIFLLNVKEDSPVCTVANTLNIQ